MVVSSIALLFSPRKKLFPESVEGWINKLFHSQPLNIIKLM